MLSVRDDRFQTMFRSINVVERMTIREDLVAVKNAIDQVCLISYFLGD
jgi:hypothetical protein